MDKTKKIIKVLLILSICSIFIISTCGGIFKIVIKNNIHSEFLPSSEATGFDLADAMNHGNGVYELSDDDYGKESFVINNLEGLLAFRGIVNSHNNGDWFRGDFLGKTIYLNSDINCGGRDVTIGYCNNGENYVFKGLFNGQNHTISNYKFGTEKRCYYKEGIYGYYGLFTYLTDDEGGGVKNLRIRDGQCDGAYGDCVGALVGYGYMLRGSSHWIYKCAVENIKFYDRFETINGIIAKINNNTCSSIVGTGGGVQWSTIQDCYVDFSSIEIIPSSGPASKTTTLVGPAEYCIQRNIFLPYFTSCTLSYCVIKTNDTTIELTHADVNATDNVYDGSNTMPDTRCTSIGNNADTTCPWYNGGDEFNDGWLYPYHFIVWEKLQFKIDDETKTKFSDIEIDGTEEDYIYVPKIWLNVNASGKVGIEIDVCARFVKANPKVTIGDDYTVSWVFYRKWEGCATYILKCYPNTDKYIKIKIKKSDSYIQNYTNESKKRESAILYTVTHENDTESKYAENDLSITYEIDRSYKIEVKAEYYKKMETTITYDHGTSNYQTQDKICFKSLELKFETKDNVTHVLSFYLNEMWESDLVLHLGTHNGPAGDCDALLSNKGAIGDIFPQIGSTTAEIRLYMTEKEYNMQIQ